MEITLTLDQEAQLTKMAASYEKAPSELASEMFSEKLQERAQFLAKIELARAQYERGEFLEEEEMDALIERNFDRQ